MLGTEDTQCEVRARPGHEKHVTELNQYVHNYFIRCFCFLGLVEQSGGALCQQEAAVSQLWRLEV